MGFWANVPLVMRWYQNQKSNAAKLANLKTCCPQSFELVVHNHFNLLSTIIWTCCHNHLNLLPTIIWFWTCCPQSFGLISILRRLSIALPCFCSTCAFPLHDRPQSFLVWPVTMLNCSIAYIAFYKIEQKNISVSVSCQSIHTMTHISPSQMVNSVRTIS